MTFYDLYYLRKNEEALELLRRLRIVPLSTNEVDTMVDTFCGFSEQVRRVRILDRSCSAQFGSFSQAS